jgi:hypothetical protein
MMGFSLSVSPLPITLHSVYLTFPLALDCAIDFLSKIIVPLRSSNCCVLVRLFLRARFLKLRIRSTGLARIVGITSHEISKIPKYRSFLFSHMLANVRCRAVKQSI